MRKQPPSGVWRQGFERGAIRVEIAFTQPCLEQCASCRPFWLHNREPGRIAPATLHDPVTAPRSFVGEAEPTRSTLGCRIQIVAPPYDTKVAECESVLHHQENGFRGGAGALQPGRKPNAPDLDCSVGGRDVAERHPSFSFAARCWNNGEEGLPFKAADPRYMRGHVVLCRERSVLQIGPRQVCRLTYLPKIIDVPRGERFERDGYAIVALKPRQKTDGFGDERAEWNSGHATSWPGSMVVATRFQTGDGASFPISRSLARKPDRARTPSSGHLNAQVHCRMVKNPVARLLACLIILGGVSSILSAASAAAPAVLQCTRISVTGCTPNGICIADKLIDNFSITFSLKAKRYKSAVGTGRIHDQWELPDGVTQLWQFLHLLSRSSLFLVIGDRRLMDGVSAIPAIR